MVAPTRRTASTCAWSANWRGTTFSSGTCCAVPGGTSLTVSCRNTRSSTAPASRPTPERHGCRSDTVIALNLEKKLILIANSEYAGENKKSVFTLLNYILPAKGVMPMHCSANHADGDPSDAAVFFGLSGTGKTTLSADPARTLVGDDEHGWSEGGTFNFEGGCYAKTINLREEAEPQIYATTKKFGTVIENMVYDPETLELDFDDDSLTANTRCAYPLEQIPNASMTGLAGHPKKHRDADLRRLRRAAAHRAAHTRAGDVSFPVGLYLEGRGHRARGDRTRADILDMLRRAVHAASARGLRPASSEQDPRSRRDLLAGQYRLDGRGLRHRITHADQRRRARF